MPHESTVAHEDSPEGLPEVSPFAYRARCDQSDEKPDAKRAKVYILVREDWNRRLPVQLFKVKFL